MIVGRYRLEARLGAGGAGVVWRAEDTLLRRAIAIKQVDPSGHGQRDAMLREARAAARLDHPGAVTVFDVVQDRGRDFIVMQLVDGPNLAEVVTGGGPLDECTTANLGLRLLDVLDAAHGQGLIHRDIKPANVMFPGDGRVQLTDFGIARLMDDPRDTTTGLVRGTPQYMSPEQATGGHIGPASDLWSLGATLYFAVEGVAPFDKGQALATLNAVTAEPPRPPRRAGSLEDVLEALLSKDPEERSGALDFRRRLRGVADSGAPTRELVVPWAESVAPRSAVVPPVPRSTATDHPAAEIAPPQPEPAAEQDLAPWPDEPPEPPAEGAATPEPWSEPHRIQGPATGRRRRWLPAAVGLAVAALVAAAAVVAVDSGGSRSTPPRATGKGAQTAHASPAAPTHAGTGGGHSAPPSTSSTSGTAGTSGASAPAVPSDWVTYTDPQTGFRLQHPPGWKVSTEGTHTTFSDPATGDYVLIDHQTPPASTPQGPWYTNEPGFAASHTDYQRIGITTTQFHGYPAALWEYEYTSGSTRLHAIDLGMIVGSHGYAFNFQASQARWDGDQQEMAQLEAGFTPAG